MLPVADLYHHTARSVAIVVRLPILLGGATWLARVMVGRRGIASVFIKAWESDAGAAGVHTCRAGVVDDDVRSIGTAWVRAAGSGVVDDDIRRASGATAVGAGSAREEGRCDWSAAAAVHALCCRHAWEGDIEAHGWHVGGVGGIGDWSVVGDLWEKIGVA